MAFCPQCGSKHDQGRFCPTCGFDFEARPDPRSEIGDVPAAEVAPSTPPADELASMPAADVAPKATPAPASTPAAPTAPATPPAPKAPAPTRAVLTPMIKALMAVAAVGLAALVVYLAFLARGGDKEAPSASPASPDVVSSEASTSAPAASAQDSSSTTNAAASSAQSAPAASAQDSSTAASSAQDNNSAQSDSAAAQDNAYHAIMSNGWYFNAPEYWMQRIDLVEDLSSSSGPTWTIGALGTEHDIGNGTTRTETVVAFHEQEKGNSSFAGDLSNPVLATATLASGESANIYGDDAGAILYVELPDNRVIIVMTSWLYTRFKGMPDVVQTLFDLQSFGEPYQEGGLTNDVVMNAMTKCLTEVASHITLDPQMTPYGKG